MKSLDSDLGVLSDQLECLDYVVVKHGDFVCVRLPLISSVRVYHSPERGFRFVLTEGCLTRLQQLIAGRGMSRSPLTSGQRPALAESAQYAFVDQRVSDPTSISW